MEERSAGKGAGEGPESSGIRDGGASARSEDSSAHHQPANGRNRSMLASCRPPVIITADPPLPAIAQTSPEVPTLPVRRSAATRTKVSSWSGSYSRVSSSSSQPPASATTASRGHHLHQHQHQHQHQLQPAAPVEVSPGDDADTGDVDPPGRAGGDGGGSEDGCGMIQEEATTSSTAASNHEGGGSSNIRDSSRGRGRDTEQQQRVRDPEDDDDDERGRGRGLPSSPSRSFRRLGGSNGRSGLLVGLGDLPDAALARAFFSGFLDSLEVASSLRLVSRRVMAVASAACQVMDLHRISLSDQDLANVAAAFPRLVHVDLSFCKGLGEGTGASLRPCHQTLQALSLRGTGVSSTAVADLRHFHQLTFLDVSQSLESASRNVTLSSLIEGLQGLERLKKLSLAWNKEGVTDAVVKQLCVGGVNGLVELDLSLCSQITIRSIQALSAQRLLRVLSLRACIHVSDNAVEELVTACPALSCLDLAHLPRLTGKSVRALVSLEGLKKLDLRCCELITAADVVGFRASRPSTRVAELRAWWP